MEFVPPETLAGLMPFTAAAATVLFGIIALLAPRAMLRLPAGGGHPHGLAEARASLAGFHLGVGSVALLMFDQPFVQLLLGAGWLFAAVGRLVSMLFDRGFTPWNGLRLALELALAWLALAPVFGFVPG